MTNGLAMTPDDQRPSSSKICIAFSIKEQMEFIERAFASDKNKESDIARRFLEFLMEILSDILK